MKDKLYCKSGGCSAKLGAKKLSHILEKIDKYPSDQLLVGFDSHDDGAVYQINEHQAIVSTLDFFPPMVEDPYLFGQIAATNALSDIYAMGGTPLTALNIVCFNDQDDLNILGKIIEGGNDKLKEAHVTLAGGHSIRDESTKYGLSVTGMVDPHHILSNKDVQENDVLILTKKLGVGLTLNAARLNDASKDMLDEVYQSMTLLNKYAYDLFKKYRIHALTDVTGFGLLVHLDEMLNHQKSAVLDKNKIPYFKDCPYYVNEFYLTGAAQQNRYAVEDKVYFDKENFILEEILYDPQTSGGLLASVQEEDVDIIIKDFQDKGYQCYVIGRVIKKDKFDIYVR